MAEPVQLQFRAPTRGMPPTHLADLTDDEVKAAVKDAGLPGFRANQIARQYYGRLEGDPMAMTDLPENLRSTVKDMPNRSF